LASWRFILVLAAAGIALAPRVHAAQPLPRAVVEQRQQDVDHLFNWYYAAVYGTGGYKIGEESVAVLRLPFGHTVNKATDEQWGLKLNFPVSAAVGSFDLSDFDFGRVKVTGLSVLPGVEVEIPLSAAWTVRPFVNLGVGWEFQRDSSALIYSVGASTSYRLSNGKDLISAVGGKLVYAGYQSGGQKDTLGALTLGGELGFPMRWEISGRQAIVGVQVTGTVYFNNLDFFMPGTETEEVSHEGQIALTLGVRREFEVLGIGFDRIGIGYLRGSNGLRGVRLVGSFPF
jgi:hypothetical protein